MLRERSGTPALVLVNVDGYPGREEARNVAIAGDGRVTFDRYARATTLIPTREREVEAPVAIFGTHGRPIHRPERHLGRQRLQLPASFAAAR